MDDSIEIIQDERGGNSNYIELMDTSHEDDTSCINLIDTSHEESPKLTDVTFSGKSSIIRGRQDPQTPTRFPLLESVSARFKQQECERQTRIDTMRTKREVEVAHSRYLKQNVATPDELAASQHIVDAWAHKHGMVDRQARRILTAKRRTSRTESATMRDSSVLTPQQPAVSGTPTIHRPGPSQRGTNVVTDLTSPTVEINTDNYSHSPQRLGSEPIEEAAVFTCNVLNCGAIFSSMERRNHHRHQFKHSPCNPCLFRKDCRLPYDPVTFMCPKCDREFQDINSCRVHTRKKNHLCFLPPVSVGGYICGQCLGIFGSYVECWQHMDMLKHQDMAYPFTDDFSRSWDFAPRTPVPVAMELMTDFYERCMQVAFTVQCLECGLPIPNAAELYRHELETNNQHIMSALTNTTQVEVFAGYFGDSMCDTCLRILSGPVKKHGVHDCAENVRGTVVENSCTSFTQFVKKCGLSYLESVKFSADNSNVDGSSRSSSPVTDIVDESSNDTEAAGEGSPRSVTSTDSGSLLVQIYSSKDNHQSLDQRTFPQCNGSHDNHSSSCQSNCVMIGQKRLAASTSANAASGNKKTSPQKTGNHTHPVSTAVIEFKGVSNSRWNPDPTPSLPGPSNPSTDSVAATKSPVDPENLAKMRHIIFLDLDNWPKFFQKLQDYLPARTFVWAFYGGGTIWIEPTLCPPYDYQKMNGWFYLHKKCSRAKDAADVAILLSVGKMDGYLPKSVAFTILSGDKVFCEVENQMKERKTVVIDPHTAQKLSDVMIYAMINSVVDK